MHLLLVSLPGPTDNTPVLRALEYGVIILLWLFFMWVVRAVWVEVRPLKRRRRPRAPTPNRWSTARAGRASASAST